MAYTTQTLAGSSVLARISAFFADLSERSARHTTYRKTVSELSELTDRELNDLGISRAMITNIAHEAAYQN